MFRVDTGHWHDQRVDKQKNYTAVIFKKVFPFIKKVKTHKHTILLSMSNAVGVPNARVTYRKQTVN